MFTSHLCENVHSQLIPRNEYIYLIPRKAAKFSKNSLTHPQSLWEEITFHNKISGFGAKSYHYFTQLNPL